MQFFLLNAFKLWTDNIKHDLEMSKEAVSMFCCSELENNRPGPGRSFDLILKKSKCQ